MFKRVYKRKTAQPEYVRTYTNPQTEKYAGKKLEPPKCMALSAYRGQMQTTTKCGNKILWQKKGGVEKGKKLKVVMMNRSAAPTHQN